jgi:2-polyprenyl-3-methyl-5-hydroxy-6-metoxy-1,4-benzoquinol methylase
VGSAAFHDASHSTGTRDRNSDGRRQRTRGRPNDLVIEACGGSLDGRTVVDLGCLEGGFTLAFAENGAQLALGIEAREISVRRCELARDLLGLDNAEFVEADIKDELAKRDAFDVVFAAGILYHVADPAGFLVTMREACKGVALIDTHVAREDDATHGCSVITTRNSGDQTYRGRIFPEYAPMYPMTRRTNCSGLRGVTSIHSGP